MPKKLEVTYENFADEEEGLLPYLAEVVKKLIKTEDEDALQRLVEDIAKTAECLYDLNDEVVTVKKKYDQMKNRHASLMKDLEQRKAAMEALELEMQNEFGVGDDIEEEVEEQEVLIEVIEDKSSDDAAIDFPVSSERTSNSVVSISDIEAASQEESENAKTKEDEVTDDEAVVEEIETADIEPDIFDLFDENNADLTEDSSVNEFFNMEGKATSVAPDLSEMGELGHVADAGSIAAGAVTAAGDANPSVSAEDALAQLENMTIEDVADSGMLPKPSLEEFKEEADLVFDDEINELAQSQEEEEEADEFADEVYDNVDIDDEDDADYKSLDQAAFLDDEDDDDEYEDEEEDEKPNFGGEGAPPASNSLDSYMQDIFGEDTEWEDIFDSDLTDDFGVSTNTGANDNGAGKEELDLASAHSAGSSESNNEDGIPSFSLPDDDDANPLDRADEQSKPSVFDDSNLALSQEEFNKIKAANASDDDDDDDVDMMGAFVDITQL